MSGVATQADIEALERTPAELARSTYELLQRSALRTPDAPALSFFLTMAEHTRPETWTYAQLLGQIHRTANFFHELGADEHTVIAYILPNLPETHFVLWGGEATGVVMAINPLLEPATLGALLRTAGASIVVTLAPFPKVDLYDKVARALVDAPSVKHVVLVSLADRVRGPKKLVARLAQKLAALRAPRLSARVHDFGRSIARRPGDRLRSGRSIRPGDRSSLFCTGGTTGLPKIAARHHENEVANAHMAASVLGNGIGTGKNLFCGLPLFHVNAVMATGLVPFSLGAHVVLGTPQGYRGDGVVKRFWELVEHHQLHFFSGVPTLYSSLLQVPIAGRRVDTLEYGLCGAAPLPVTVVREFEQRTGLKILEGYGLTEATCVSTLNPPDGERRTGSIGLRLPGQQMKVVVLDGGTYVRDCADGEVGTFVVCGANVFDGYLAAEQNARLFPDLGDGQRWLDTGDLGHRDADGYFFVTGRSKELIIRGGHNIDPAAIEAPLHRHAAVLLAAAVGRPDEHAGELPVAYVQLRPGMETTPAELLEFLAREIPERSALPKQLHILDALPLTAIGKIHKPTLKKLEIESALGAALKGFAATLEVLDDPARGTMVRATLADPAQREAVAAILGRFVFPVVFADARGG